MAVGLALISGIMMAGTLSMVNIVKMQETRHVWFVFSNYGLMIVPFMVYLISAIAETNRLPFDLPEAEGELVGGFHTEYSSLKFAIFMLAEYVNMTTVSALATTMFLGGWHAPWPLSLWDGANTGWWPLIWFVAKVWGFLFFYIWLRATLPRLRYDQFMAMGWKVLIPVSLAWIMTVAVTKWLRMHGSGPWTTTAINVGFLALVGLVAATWKIGRRNRSRAVPPAPPPDQGAFPVPPIPSKEKAHVQIA